MQESLAVTALLMGLAGGPHCVAMCGAACGGISGAAPGKTTRSLLIFQVGRVAGYAAMGAVAAASMQGIGWLAGQSAALRPLWTMFHVAAALLGLVLLWQARQPAWLEAASRRLWHFVRPRTQEWSAISFAASAAPAADVSAAGKAWRVSEAGAPLVMGALWSLLPCGLLYSALLVAALSGNPAEGAAVMVLFALGSGAFLMAGPWLWLRLKRAGKGDWAVRLVGLTLFLMSLGALWMGLVHDTAPWCTTP